MQNSAGVLQQATAISPAAPEVESGEGGNTRSYAAWATRRQPVAVALIEPTRPDGYKELTSEQLDNLSSSIRAVVASSQQVHWKGCPRLRIAAGVLRKE